MLKKCIDSARKQKIIVNRTIRVADKGLNCGNNIYEALMNKDGYIFSKSVIKLSEKEKVWVDLENGYIKTYENGILVFKIKSCIDEFTYEHTDENKKKNPFKSKEKRVVYRSKKLYDKKMFELDKLEVKVKNLSLSKAKKEKYNAYASYIDFVGLDKNGEITDKTIIKINQEKLNRDRKYAGFNMIVTSEINASDNDIYDIYHYLWRIEETFRILKTNLDARPVYVQKESTIFGHFLVCYTSILMVRILQFLVYKNEIKSNELIEFMKTFNVYNIDDDLCEKDKRLIIVIDNMDRLPKLKVQELWAAIHSFFSEIQYDNKLSVEETYVKQEGSNGLSKVVYATKESNGVILDSQMASEDVITEPTKKIVVAGAKGVYYVGNSTYWVWPTSKPYRISSCYAYRNHPIRGQYHFHAALDITGTKSKNIYAIQSGTVISSFNDNGYHQGAGNNIKIEHANNYVSQYMHLAKSLVKVGDHVEKGQLIGIMGRTGSATGVHLDFRVFKNGNNINPFSIYYKTAYPCYGK